MSDENKTNVERLVEAGALKADSLSEEHKAAINEMSEDEVNAILSASGKLGGAGYNFEDQGGF